MRVLEPLGVSKPPDPASPASEHGLAWRLLPSVEEGGGRRGKEEEQEKGGGRRRKERGRMKE